MALYNPKRKGNETQVDSPFVESLIAENDVGAQRPGGVRDKEVGMGGVGWPKSHRGGGSAPRSKGQQKDREQKDREGGRCQWKEAKVQNSRPPTRQKVSKPGETPTGVAGTSPSAEILHFP